MAGLSPPPMQPRSTITARVLFTLLCAGLFVTRTSLAADTTAPTVACAVSVPVLSRNDHKFVDVGLTIVAHDDVDSNPRLGVRVFSNEDDDETGNGNFSPDARIVPPQVLLRAERNAAGNGRVYVIIVTATDAAGNTALNFCTVVVPRDQSAASQTQVQQLAAQVSTQVLPPVGYVTVGDGPDKSAFRVAINSPVDGASFAWGAPVSLTATASFTPTKVEYYDGFNKTGEATTPPFTFAFLNPGPGGHIVEAVATNATGDRYSSNAITFTQRANVPPSVSLSGPAGTAVFQLGQPIPIAATATDIEGAVAKVEFFAGPAKIGEATSTPFAMTWIAATAGTYDLSAVATDAAGASTTSSFAAIRINAPPKIDIVMATTSFDVGQSIPLHIATSDSDGNVTKAEFFVDGVKIGEASSSPFDFDGTAAAAGTYVIRAVATDNDGAMTTSSPVTIVVNAPAATPAPKAIDDLAASRTSFMRVDLTWTDPSLGVATFTIQRTADNGRSWQTLGSLPAGSTTFSDPAAPQPTLFYYRVFSASTDGESLPSNLAASNGTNPLITDSDNDGLSDAVELDIYHTDPRNNDSDGDAALDGDEVEAGSDPLDAASFPPRFVTPGRGINYDWVSSGWNFLPYYSVRWGSDWPNGPSGSEEGSDPLSFTGLSSYIADKAPFPDAPAHGPNFGWYIGGATANSWAIALPQPQGGNTASATVDQRRVWWHRFPAQPREDVMPVLVVKQSFIDAVAGAIQLNVHTLTIPAGGTTSQPLDLLNNLTQDFANPLESHSETVQQTFRQIDIVVRPQGRPIPRDGVLIETYDRLEVALNRSDFDNIREFDDKLTWECCRLRGDGSFTEWAPIALDDRAITFATGTRFVWEPYEAGIYKIRVKIDTDEGPKTVEYLRKRDEPYATDSSGLYNEIYRKGKPDYVGITDGHREIDVRNEARGKLGSIAYARTIRLPDGTEIIGATVMLYPGGPLLGPNLDKCNAFVYHTANAGGATVFHMSGLQDRYPPTAYGWWDVNEMIQLWTRLPDSAMPQPGFIVARPDSRTLPGGTNQAQRWGHVGILDYDGAWIQAGARNVNKAPHLTDSRYQPAGMRQYHSN